MRRRSLTDGNRFARASRRYWRAGMPTTRSTFRCVVSAGLLCSQVAPVLVACMALVLRRAAALAARRLRGLLEPISPPLDQDGRALTLRPDDVREDCLAARPEDSPDVSSPALAYGLSDPASDIGHMATSKEIATAPRLFGRRGIRHPTIQFWCRQVGPARVGQRARRRACRSPSREYSSSWAWWLMLLAPRRLGPRRGARLLAYYAEPRTPELGAQLVGARVVAGEAHKTKPGNRKGRWSRSAILLEGRA
jgi:hypothetical protein